MHSNEHADRNPPTKLRKKTEIALLLAVAVLVPIFGISLMSVVVPMLDFRRDIPFEYENNIGQLDTPLDPSFGSRLQ